ncbi:MAG: prepilin peptidase [Acidobacteria bacterium]|nr:prepilin peptidase [Acidobacteriota bacterium]
MTNQIITSIVLLLLLAIVIAYYDVRYRRIPNLLVIATLICGLILNIKWAGWAGAAASLKGGALAFGLMLILHIFSALGAGDVKLFASIGSIIGVQQVPTAYVVVIITGGVVALFTAALAGTLRETFHRVSLILVNLLSGWQPPRFPTPADKKHTVPYGVAITMGSLVSLAFFSS